VGDDIVLIVGALGNPFISDSEIQGRIGIGEDRNPLIGMYRHGIIQVGADEYLLDAQFGILVAE